MTELVKLLQKQVYEGSYNWKHAEELMLLAASRIQELEQALTTTPLAARVPDSTYESVCSKIVERYVVEKRTGGGFWPYCVRAVGGSMELFIGQKNKCDEVAQALQTACLDGAFMVKVAAPQPVAQPEQPDDLKTSYLDLLQDMLDAKEAMRGLGIEQGDFPTMFAALLSSTHPQPERVALSDEQAVKALQMAIDDVRAVGLQVEAAAYIVGYFCNRVNGIKGAQQ